MKKWITLTFCIIFVAAAAAFGIKKYGEYYVKDDSAADTEQAAEQPVSDENIVLIDDMTAVVNDYQIKSVSDLCEIGRMSGNYGFKVENVYYDNNIIDIVKNNTINFESRLSTLKKMERTGYYSYFDDEGNLDGEEYTYMYVEVSLTNYTDEKCNFVPLSLELVYINGNTVSLLQQKNNDILDYGTAHFVTELDGNDYLNFMVVIQENIGETCTFLMTYIIPVQNKGMYAAVYEHGLYYTRMLKDNSMYYVKLE